MKLPTELVKSPNEKAKSLTEIVKSPTDSTLYERHSPNQLMNGFGALNGKIEMESNPVCHRGYSVRYYNVSVVHGCAMNELHRD